MSLKGGNEYMHLSRAVGHHTLATHKNLLHSLNENSMEERSLIASVKILQRELFSPSALCSVIVQL